MMKSVPTDHNEVMRLAHLQWINERTPAAAEMFERALLAAAKADRDRRATLASGEK